MSKAGNKEHRIQDHDPRFETKTNTKLFKITFDLDIITYRARQEK